MITREQAIEIARVCAKAKPQSYYTEPFHPHEWVVDAIIAAANSRDWLADVPGFAEWRKNRKAAYDSIPAQLRDSLDRYARDGVPTGDCLRAVLAGDLFNAFKRADPVTTAAMPAIVAYILNELPAICCGSEAAVDAWIAHHLERLRQERGDG